MKVLVAPDKFKDALDAEQAAAAIAAGIEEARPQAAILRCPMADGGDGTGRILAAALGAGARRETVLDPRGNARQATWWRTPDGGTAIVEMAEASGLALLSAKQRNPLVTTSFGTGQLLAAACGAGVTRILLCVGGSATVDGGAGCIQALGWELIDDSGAVLDRPATGGDLLHIADARWSRSAPLRKVEVRVLCDVDSPLLGPDGAAARFGPQKGAEPPAIELLEQGLARWASILTRGREAGIALAGAGAAGGLPAGLAALLGADLRAGLDEVARVVGLDDLLGDCDLCITGEGRLDEQTLRGKAVRGVAAAASNAGVPAVAFVGTIRPPPGVSAAAFADSLRLQQVIEISDSRLSMAIALCRTADNLRQHVREWLRMYQSRFGEGTD